MVEASVHDAQAHPECNGNGGQVMCVTYSHSTGAFRNELRLVSTEGYQHTGSVRRLAAPSLRHSPRVTDNPEIIPR